MTQKSNNATSPMAEVHIWPIICPLMPTDATIWVQPERG